jgi:hypothetical protein
MESFTNPFKYDENDLVNIMSEAASNDLCAQEEIETRLFAECVAERISKDDVNLWPPPKRRKLQTWISALKQRKVTVGNKVLEMKEDRVFTLSHGPCLHRMVSSSTAQRRAISYKSWRRYLNVKPPLQITTENKPSIQITTENKLPLQTTT